MVINILLTGLPGVGKSTLFEKVLKAYKSPMRGLLTREIRLGADTGRLGFQMGSLRKKRRPGTGFVFYGNVIAHVNYSKERAVSRYGVDVAAINALCTSYLNQNSKPGTLLYADEIAQMQLFSSNFPLLVIKYLDAPNTAIMTLSAVFHNSLTDEIRKRKDVMIIEVTPQNREMLQGFILGLISKIDKAKQYITTPEIFEREGELVEVNSGHGKRIVNLVGKTCTCDFHKKYPNYHTCSHLIAAQHLFTA